MTVNKINKYIIVFLGSLNTLKQDGTLYDIEVESSCEQW